MPYTLTPRRLAANRANAQHSTGPRTEAGKRRASQNSLHHHAFSAHLCHPGEDEHDFHLLRNAILADLSPQTILELCLADRVVSAAWRLKRLQHADHCLTQMHQVDYRAFVEAHNAKLEDRRDRFLDNCRRHHLDRNPDGSPADEATLLRTANIPDPLPLPTADATSEDDGPTVPAPGFFIAGSLHPDPNAPDSDHATPHSPRTTPFERLLAAELRLQGMMARALRDLRQLRLDRRNPDNAPEEFTPFATPDADADDQDDDADDAADDLVQSPEDPTPAIPPPPSPKGDSPRNHTTPVNAAGEGRGEGPSVSSSSSQVSNLKSSPSVSSVPSVVNPLLQNEPICHSDSLLTRAASLAARSLHPRRKEPPKP